MTGGGGWIALLLALLTGPTPGWAADGPVYDVVVYGGTAGGVVAAVTAAREGHSVVLIEPSQHLGGMTSG
ncbi:MAG: FAD-dependent oxidoreductase, partial [Planctomycetaceae bacterium]